MKKCKINMAERVEIEFSNSAERIRKRHDYIPELDPFVEILTQSSHPEKMKRDLESPLILQICVQVPLELFCAAGLQTFRLCCGSFQSSHASGLNLPALTCPMIKSTAGMLQCYNSVDQEKKHLIIPTTCDWVVKFPELMEINLQSDARNEKYDVHFMELPHLREDDSASERWLNECFTFKKKLEKITGQRIGRKKILSSIEKYAIAWKSFSELIDLRRRNMISALNFSIIANSFHFEDVETWTLNVNNFIIKTEGMRPETANYPVFLAGSPIAFPNLKMFYLAEEAGLEIVADDLCSSERVFPGGVCFEDESEYAIMRALAERYHKACICPTFADNGRRVNNILDIAKKHSIKGVLFHVLKGCHPFDIECIGIERKIRDAGLKFLKIETDYVEEDSQNILTRLEAFKGIL